MRCGKMGRIGEADGQWRDKGKRIEGLVDWLEVHGVMEEEPPRNSIWEIYR